MEVQVLAVRTVGKGLRIAHVKAGEFFGDCPAAPDVVERGPAFLRINLVCRDGRLGASLRVERRLEK